jgi:hypothetical protein
VLRLRKSHANLEAMKMHAPAWKEWNQVDAAIHAWNVLLLASIEGYVQRE